MNMSTGYKTWSPNYDTIKIHLLGKKNARTHAGAHTNTHSHLLESIRKLVHHSLWAGSFFKSQILITVLRTEYHSLHYQMPPLWKQTKRTARNSSFATDNWCLVSTERALFLFIFFVAFFFNSPNEEAKRNTRLLHFHLLSLSNEVSLRDDSCLNVVVRQQ